MSKVVGFDLWGTLIKQNPLFKERRKDLFEIYFPHLSVGKCEDIMSSIKKDLNNVIEDTGWQPNEDIIKEMMSRRFGYQKELIGEFLMDYRRLGIVYSPLLIDERAVDLLQNLKNKGYHLYLVSNTMFFNGSTLKTIISRLKLTQFFTKFYFSDEMKYSKPDPNICGVDFDYFIGDYAKTDGGFSNNYEKTKFIHLYSTTDKTLKYAIDIVSQD